MASKPPISSYDEPIDDSGADEVVERLKQNKDKSSANLPDAAKMALMMKGLGFTIMPLPTNAKGPPPGDWSVLARSNPAVFLTNPGTHNYAVLPPPGCFGWDVDKDAPDLLVKVGASLGVYLPETLTTITPNGRHQFYRWPEDLARPKGPMFGNVVTRWPAGDEGQGYLVGPGSVVVQENGTLGVYQMLPVDDDEPIADLPREWALAALKFKEPRHDTVPTAGGPLAEFGQHYELPESVPEGMRYESIVSYTAHLYNRGLSVDEMWPMVENLLAPRFAVQKERAVLRSDFGRATKDLDVRLGEPKRLPNVLSSAAPAPAVPSRVQGPSVEGDVKPVEPALALTIDDLIAELQAGDPTKWLIESWLPANSLMWFAGQPKSMKSLSILQMLASFVEGSEWMGKTPLADVTRVAWYVTREGSRADMEERLSRIRAQHTFPSDRFRVSFLRPIAFDAQSFLDISAYLVQVESDMSIHGWPLQLVMVLDPLRDFLLPGWDENDSKVMGEVKRWARALIDAYPWLSIIIVHHLRKSAGYGSGDGLDMSGSGAGYAAGDGTVTWTSKRDDVDDDDDIDDAADNGVLVELKPRYGTYKVEPRGGAIIKGKWMFDAAKLSFVRQRGVVVKNGRAEPGTRVRSLLDIVIASGVNGITIADLAAASDGVTPENVRTAMKRAEDRSTVTSAIPVGDKVTRWYARGYAPSEQPGLLDESEESASFADPLHSLD